MKQYILLTHCLVLNFSLICSQNRQKVDVLELNKEFQTSLSDVKKAKICNKIYHYYSAINNDSALIYAQKALFFSEKSNFLEGKIRATSNIGSIFYYTSENAKALSYFLKSTQLTEQFEKIHGVSKFSQTQLSKNLNNLGAIHLSQQEFEEAEKYFKKSLKIDLKLNEKLSAANSYNNIGTIKEAQNKYDEALKNYFKALKIKLDLKDSLEIPSTLINIGVIKMNNKEFKEAISYFTTAKRYAEAKKNLKDLCLSYINSGDAYYLKKDYQLANEYYLKGIEICEKQKYLAYLSYAYESIALSYLKQQNFQKAYEFHEKFTNTKDKIYSEENTRLVKEMQTKFETTQKEKEIKLLKKDKDLQEIQLKNNQKVLLFTFIFLFLIILFTLYIFKTNKQKQKIYSEINIKNEKLEIAYKIVEDKQKEILDSINYAKRIQAAILPPDKNFKNHLPDSFIIYKPKDIVAGDFYWIEKSKETTLFAVADCTGHGVPGAMVSVICNNGLNRSVREHGLSSPGAILDKTREIVIQEFEKSEEELRDGMDISLCALTNTKLQWAGANNPLWIIRNGDISEFKANKQPIGRYLTSEPFTTHEIELEKGDLIYIFTDGLQDQFGGKSNRLDGKKFKISKLRELLLSVSDKTMQEQQFIIDQTFESWKGDLEQVDDVCIIGVRV
jgi:serine phosphatase RsbU (regulator of sigma subunit)/Tfp pilus assembly protein PilF